MWYPMNLYVAPKLQLNVTLTSIDGVAVYAMHTYSAATLMLHLEMFSLRKLTLSAQVWYNLMKPSNFP